MSRTAEPDLQTVIDAAISNLSLSQNDPVRLVFGKALQARSQQSLERDCGFFHLLARGGWPVDSFNRSCSEYLHEIADKEAEKKCWNDMRGCVASCARDFNGGCADFLAEVNAVSVLRKESFNRFTPIFSTLPDGTTADYIAFDPIGRPAYVEVKNLRSNLTVTDIVLEEIRHLNASEPGCCSFNLTVDYAYDEPPTGEDMAAIERFVGSLKGRKPDFHETLVLSRGAAGIKGTQGHGYALMSRAAGLDEPEPLDKARFISRVRGKAEKALSQMKGTTYQKVVVINYDSPSAVISGDFIEDAKQEILQVFGGNVSPYVLHYGSNCSSD